MPSSLKRLVAFTLLTVIGSTVAVSWPTIGASKKPGTTVLTYHYIHEQQPTTLSERYFVVSPARLATHLRIITQSHYPTILLLRKDDPETMRFVGETIKPSGVPYVWHTGPTYRTFTPDNLASVLPLHLPPHGSYPVNVKEVSGIEPIGDFTLSLPNRYINADCFSWRKQTLNCTSVGVLLGVLTLAMGVLATYRQQVSSMVLMALIPWYSLRLVLFGLPLTLLELLMLGVILVHLPSLFGMIRRGFNIQIVPATLIALTLIVSVVSFVYPSFSASGFGYARAFIGIPVLWVLAMLITLKRMEHLYWPAYGYIAASVIVAALALTRYAIGDAYIHFDGQVRATFFGNPNHLASFLNSAVTLSLGMLVIQKRRLFLLTTLLLASVLWLTASKGALLGTAVAVVYLVVVPRFPKRLSAYLPSLMLALFGITLVVQLVLAARGRYTETADISVRTILSSNASRFAVYQTSMILISQSPILGIGLANFRDRFRQTVSAASPEQDTAFAHNIFLDVWLQLGIVGLYVFFLWIAGAFRYPIKGPSHTLVLFLQAALLARLTHGMVDSVLLKNDFAVITIFLIGALWWKARLGDSS